MQRKKQRTQVVEMQIFPGETLERKLTEPLPTRDAIESHARDMHIDSRGRTIVRAKDVEQGLVFEEVMNHVEKNTHVRKVFLRAVTEAT
jgi:hypothetical protein